MGVKLCCKERMVNDIYNEKIGAAKSVVYSAKSLGSAQVPVSPKALSNIYWSIAIPRMLYGLDVTAVNDKCICSLENSHRTFAKYIQNIPQNTPNPAPLATLGWLSISAYIAFIKIMFIVRTLCLPVSNVYRQVMVYRLKLLRESKRLESEMFIGPVKSMLICV